MVGAAAVFARARQQLASFDGIAALDPPTTFRGVLRDYQREALGGVAFLRRFGFGGCLADEMGLGKTVMVLAALGARRHERASTSGRPSLVVVPRSNTSTAARATGRHASNDSSRAIVRCSSSA